MAFADVPEQPVLADGFSNRYLMADGGYSFLDSAGDLRRRTGLTRILKILRTALIAVYAANETLRKIFAENEEMLNLIDFVSQALQLAIAVITAILNGGSKQFVSATIQNAVPDLQSTLDGMAGD